MGPLRELSQLFGGGPQATFVAILLLAVITLFKLLLSAHGREVALSIRVVVLTEKLAPVVLKLVDKPKRPSRALATGSNPVLPPRGEP